MADLKEAYETLGLSENASREDLENRYFLLMRRHKSQNGRNPADSGESPIDIDRISAAYKTIKDNMLEKAKLENPLYLEEMKKSPFRRKLDHFFYYYRLHLIIGLALAVGVYFVGASIAERQREKAEEAKLPPANLSLMLYGEFHTEDEKAFAEELLAHFPDWQRIKVVLAYAPWEARDQYGLAAQQKAMVMLATEKPDLYIIDQERFDIHRLQGSFQPLDDLIEPLLEEGTVKESQLLYGKSEDDLQEHIYGVDLSDSEELASIRLENAESIAVLRINSRHPQEALHFIETMSK